MAQEKSTNDGQNQPSVKIRYETTDVDYVSQFMINAGAEELIINFSPGYLSDPNDNENVLPIHSRIAMTYGSATRLVQTLTQVLQNVENAKKKSRATEENRAQQEASLPKLS